MELITHVSMGRISVVFGACEKPGWAYFPECRGVLNLYLL
jgi:hypothetical protein